MSAVARMKTPTATRVTTVHGETASETLVRARSSRPAKQYKTMTGRSPMSEPAMKWRYRIEVRAAARVMGP
jgi:hypothetical protein